MVQLSEKQRIEVLMMISYGDRVRSHQEVCQIFRDKSPNQPISPSTVSRIENKFRKHGNVTNLPKSGRPVTLNEDAQFNMLLEIENNPHATSRNIALDYDVSHTSVLKFLKAQKFHPYKLQLVHELAEDDFDRRQEFCEQMVESCGRDPMFSRDVLFSDEATFPLNGTINRQNCRYWAGENPHWMQEIHTQYPQKINVWTGIIGDRIIGPFFFANNLTGERHLQFLQLELMPVLAALFANANNFELPNNSVWL